jgi:hypothetical protein
MPETEQPQEKRPLCPSCREAWLAWLDYKITPPITLVQIGKPTVARVQEAQRARAREWRETIRFQQNLIEQICARQHHDLGEQD